MEAIHLRYTLLLFVLAIDLKAQQGFNHKLQLSTGHTSFTNIVAHNDTLSIIGVVLDAPFSTSTQNIVFLQLDTFGNLLNKRVIQDSWGDDLVLSLNYGFIRTKKGGFALVGTPFYRQAGFVMRLDERGNKVSYVDNVDTISKVIRHQQILEIETGFMVFGERQISDFSVGVFLAKTDSIGNVEWEKWYGVPGINRTVNSVQKLNDNLFLVAGSHGKDSNGQTWYHSLIFAIDSLGNVLWEFKGPKNEESSARGIAPTPNGGFIYGAGSYEPISQNEFASNIHLVCRDSNMNLLWEVFPTPTDYYINTFMDVQPSPDGTWLALGNWPPPVTPPGGINYLAGGLIKVNPLGDTLWNQIFTGYPEHPIGTFSNTGGMAVLPSGSIVVVGETYTYWPQQSTYAGWVIKISPDGCVDTLLCATSPAHEPLGEAAVPVYRAYPNPSTGLFQVMVQNAPANALNFKVFDAAGRLVRSAFAGSTGTAFSQTLDLTDLPAGLYLLQISDGQHVGALRLAKM